MTFSLEIFGGLGIYHVMMRGVNHQIIFEHPKDYTRFQDLLNQMAHPRDELNQPLPPSSTIYAYCLMPNHVHISAAYALFYNKKYERVGHLFQDRFKSEPVNDESYFFTLIRYIHQNPVAAGLSADVASYPWSSWKEYESGNCSPKTAVTRSSTTSRNTEQASDNLSA